MDQKKAIFVSLFILFFSLHPAFGQSAEKYHGINGSFGYQRSLFMNVGYSGTGIIRLSNGITFGMISAGGAVGLNYYNKNESYYSAKIMAELSYCWFFAGKIEAGIYSPDFVHYDLRITPNLGISAVGMISLYYGYAIPVSKNKFENIGRHTVSLCFNIPAVERKHKKQVD